MSRQRQAECPQCFHQFLVSRDEGADTQCPKCEFGLLVEWFDDEDGESVRLVLPEIFFVPHPPPTGTVEAVLLAIEHTMHNQMGIPAHLMGDKLPEKVDLRGPYSYAKNPDLLEDRWEFSMECAKVQIPIIHQAQMMDMKIVNNRKRMRKRVRQRRRHWSPPHWTEYPGDW